MNNNTAEVPNQMEVVPSAAPVKPFVVPELPQDTGLKRKTATAPEVPAKKPKEVEVEVEVSVPAAVPEIPNPSPVYTATPSPSTEPPKPDAPRPHPTPETMGIKEGMDPDMSRLPKGFKLGNLAREKYAGIVMADLHDRYEIQIYCRLFEHFSYYPIYRFDKDEWVTAHDHAVREVIRFRTPPKILWQQARRS
ncbi:unnamed protein product [Caenorhabditis sp. 36 PRJEB53466]|nr:unnamed protein product [Caenorhabditis sp. 36 PRJEB53466]